MTKNIFLRLRNIKYHGKAIGEEIFIEIEAIGKIFSKNYTIKYGTIREIEEEIGLFLIDQNSFDIPVTVRIIGQDKVLNDVGVDEVKMRVDLNELRIQKKIVFVEVQENRWLLSRPKALFDVSFDIQVMDVMQYVEEQIHGFLLVKMDGYEKEQSLPAFLKVRLDRREDMRDYFTVMEGWRQGETGSIKLKDNGTSYLIPGNPYKGPVRMKYSRSTRNLIVKGTTYLAIEYPGEPWEKGFYDIEIADHPHEGGIKYQDIASKATVWFHIGHERRKGKDEEKYIHTGNGTLGCITLTNKRKWNELYNILIISRLGDSKSIGVLEVVD
ncbi:MAG: hypothetical protein G01um101418_735 [Parcubacteria group bacterium Gr01-1014_18]|nr:MAG: hypothetical protein Greene041636_725 [Parcubacteria group bacterium Greene0416_36]TSC80227.1 MAG: hypothetical protein G01um101418_735 [Parcubacteria group bacterium Gr01-1014_18]TSC98409.1 MAG: hypothetical protein Greene101420_762 [Parcubacteria group bacterium Greene1014_20]TSD06950.1 MAG: hypothetical protein Greene07142_513 [Parcubacteria group bacterium Greene0714_2]